MGLFNLFYDSGLFSKPYGAEEEYIKDLERFVDFCLTAAIDRHICLQKSEQSGLLWQDEMARGLTVSQEEALKLFWGSASRWKPQDTNLGEIECGADADELDSDKIRQELLRSGAHIMGRLSVTPQMGNYFKIRRLFRDFQLTKIETFLFLLSFVACRNAKYETVFSLLQGDGKTAPTLRLAFALFGLCARGAREEEGKLLLLEGNLFEYLAVGDKSHRGSPASRMYFLLPRVYAYLMGNPELTPELRLFASLYRWEEERDPVIVQKELAVQVELLTGHFINQTDTECRVLHLYGPKGSGKRFFIRHAAHGCKKAVIFVRLSAAIDGTAQELEAVLRTLKLECRLTGAFLCIVDEREDSEEKRSKEGFCYFINRLSEEEQFFVWVSEERTEELSRYPLHVTLFRVPLLTTGERLLIWKEFSSVFQLGESVVLSLFANQYVLSAGAIREVLIRADNLRLARQKKWVEREELADAVRQQSSGGLGELAVRINAVFTWDDLVLSAEQKRRMRQICDQVKYRGLVEEEWGFRKKSPYGRGISALFYGSPGTGKTMGAQVIANELGMELYRIDLSQMVSKYIGETEKHISELFRRAETVNAILFFDEADSLFGKRTEIHDSNDRYANSSTSQLLQRLEDYGGISILATNYVNNIDDAFKRRLKFLIHFTFPDGELRRKLFDSILPEEIPRGEQLDLDYFADRFELSGSNIKEILTNAAYQAASEHTGLANRHIVDAVKQNFLKYGKMLTDEEFGYLGE